VIFPEGSRVPIIGMNYNRYIGFNSNNLSCMIRIDDNPAEEYPVLIDDAHEGIYIAIGNDLETQEFFAEMLMGYEVIIRFAPPGQAQVTHTFSLSGITAVSRELGVDVDYYISLGEEETPQGGKIR